MLEIRASVRRPRDKAGWAGEAHTSGVSIEVEWCGRLRKKDAAAFRQACLRMVVPAERRVEGEMLNQFSSIHQRHRLQALIADLETQSAESLAPAYLSSQPVECPGSRFVLIT